MMCPGEYYVFPYVGVDTPKIYFAERCIEFGPRLLTMVSVNSKLYDCGDCL